MLGYSTETLRFTAPEPTVLFSDPVLGIAFDIPARWQVDGHPGAEAQFTVRDEIGINRRVLTLSVLSERSTTLDLALDEVRRGAWGPFIRNVQSITLGEFPARRVEMTPEGDRPPVVWLIVPPSGRAVGFIPRGDPAPVEAALVTLRAITPEPTLASSADMPPGLIFGTNTGLWRFEEDGAPEQILNRPDVVLSPDGARALYTSPDSDLWLIDLTTGEERNLTNTPDRIECCPQWWPARPDTLVFGSWPGDADLGPSTGFLSTVRVDGSDYRVLDGEHPFNALPAPAPDGQTIAYDQGGTAYLYRWDTGPVPFDPAAYGLPVQRIGSPAWSPDGRYLAWWWGAISVRGGGSAWGYSTWRTGQPISCTLTSLSASADGLARRPGARMDSGSPTPSGPPPTMMRQECASSAPMGRRSTAWGRAAAGVPAGFGHLAGRGGDVGPPARHRRCLAGRLAEVKRPTMDDHPEQYLSAPALAAARPPPAGMSHPG